MARMSSSRCFDGRTVTGFTRSFCRAKFRPTISNRKLGTASTNNHASPKCDPPGSDAARGSGGGCVNELSASAEPHAEENRLFQSWERVASTEIIEEIGPPGTGAKSPHCRPHFRDSASAREGRLFHRKAQREMG